MKTYSFLTGTLLAGMMIFAACNQDVNTALDVQADRAITFNFSVASTRTAMADDYTTNFVDEDEVGVFATKDASAEAVYTNFAYRYDGTNWNAVNEALGVPVDNSALDFYAYYPYNSTVNTLQFDFIVQADQSAENGLNKSDLLLSCNKEVPAGANQVTLNFRHALALVEITLKDFEGTEVQSVELRAVGEAAVDFSAEFPSVIAKSDVGATFIKMAKGKNADGNDVYRAIVPEQTLNTGKTLFRVITDKSVYQSAIAADVVLKANGIQPFTISKAVELAEIGVAVSDIGNWDTFIGEVPESEATQNMILANFNDMVTEDILQLTNVQQLTNGEVNNENRWFNGNNGGDGEPVPAMVTIENGELKVDAKHINGGSMWLSYTGYTLTNVKAATYVLTFEAKMVENANIEDMAPALRVAFHKQGTQGIVSTYNEDETVDRDVYTEEMAREYQKVELRVDMETLKYQKSFDSGEILNDLSEPDKEAVRKKFSIYLRPQRGVFQFRNFVFRRIE